MSESQLMQSLENAGLRCQPWQANCTHLPCGDSKKLYHSRAGLKSLEIGLLTLLSTCQPLPNSVEQLFWSSPICTKQDSAAKLPPWYQQLSGLQIPTAVEDKQEIDRLSTIVWPQLKKLGIEPLTMVAKVMTEREFNDRVDALRSKGELLAKCTFELLSGLLEVSSSKLGSDRTPVEIFCDRQGGRKNYLPMLLDWQPESWFKETAQSPQRSSYQTTHGPEMTIHFSVGGDNFQPTAVASMMAKYLRERLMEALNAFWQGHLPELAATAGYPQDAVRFRNQIEPLAKQLMLDARQWWRSR